LGTQIVGLKRFAFPNLAAGGTNIPRGESIVGRAVEIPRRTLSSGEMLAMEWLHNLMSPDKIALMPFVVGIVALLVGALAILVSGIVKIVKMLIVHRERMAKIAQGIDPDASPPTSAPSPYSSRSA
jgi:hypothetical protein